MPSRERRPTEAAKPTTIMPRYVRKERSDDEALVMRQAFAGMNRSLQFYHYDVPRWLTGDKIPHRKAESGRNSGWRHLSNQHFVAMPDKWEYPRYASWDLAFHSVVLAHIDPGMAKNQLLLLAREWYINPKGQLPAYEWNFSDVNPQSRRGPR